MAAIVSKVPMNKRIIIAFHSFGTFVLAKYINKYGGDRIFGIIDLAGMPITIFGALEHKIGVTEQRSAQNIVVNFDKVFEDY